METVLHLVSGDGDEQETTFKIARNLLDDESGSIDEVAVVAQAAGIEALTTDGEYRDRVESLLDDGVAFKGCSNTLDALGLEATDLVDDVETVPEGAVEVTRLQDEGYAYLRP